jgi:hypothetical protein
MTPDYERAASAAAETLIKFGINSAPVDSLCILKQIPGVLVVSYEDLSSNADVDRQCVITTYGERNQDSITAVNMKDGKPQYVVACNQRLPWFLLQRSLARELGHIILGHDGSLPEDVRNEEAKCFAHHLLSPRALIHSVEATGIRFTVEVLNNLTGCNDYCLSCMRKLPPIHVPAELNRAVRDLFMPYMINFFSYQRHATLKDGSALAYLGNYMEGYVE